MTTIAEMSGTPNEMAAGLQQGVNTISLNQKLTFTLYKRLVLPIDGYVFWIKADLLHPNADALFNQNEFNSIVYNAYKNINPIIEDGLPLTFDAQGSLHFSETIVQDSEQVYAKTSIMFTSLQKIDDFSRVNPQTMYITTLPNGAKAAFNSQVNRYQQAGLWHYSGHSLYSVESTQIIDNLADLNQNQIVSNTLPYWLAMSTIQLPIYPSYISPTNIKPPFVTVDIRNTHSLANAPTYTQNNSQLQLVQEDVYFTLWGTNNDVALDFQMMILKNSLSGYYGLSNMPVPIDDKHPQTEFAIIAQKKTMILTTNYYQYRSRQVAQNLLKYAFVNYNFS